MDNAEAAVRSICWARRVVQPLHQITLIEGLTAGPTRIVSHGVRAAARSACVTYDSSACMRATQATFCQHGFADGTDGVKRVSIGIARGGGAIGDRDKTHAYAS